MESLSFSVQKGICYGLLGPNGAGKTTAISIIAGTINADQGEVTLDGRSVGPNHLESKSRIGYVPQDLALYEDLSAQDNLRLFAGLQRLEGQELATNVARVLAVAGLADRRSGPVREFSGGMKRRLNLAAGLLHDPDLLILDEPTVGVDPQSRIQIFETLESLVSDGKTILYTTHYMEEVERLCQRAAIMDHGKVIAEGSLQELHRLVPSRLVLELDLDSPIMGPLPEIEGASSLSQKHKTLALDLKDLKYLGPALDAIAAAGVGISGLRTNQPTLEEVFLQLTGRRLRD